METGATPVLRSPWFALIALVPLVWLVAVTFTAGVQKIWHPEVRIGFLAQAGQLAGKAPALESALSAAQSSGNAKAIEAAAKALKANRTLQFNNRLDAIVAGIFLVLVTIILVLSVREWMLLLSRRKPAELHETPPTWLPDYAVEEGGRNFGGAAGTAALALALAKELSGEAAIERAQQHTSVCECDPAKRDDKAAQKIYLEVTERRFNGVRRCC
jgi:hypothetical protein